MSISFALSCTVALTMTCSCFAFVLLGILGHAAAMGSEQEVLSRSPNPVASLSDSHIYASFGTDVTNVSTFGTWGPIVNGPIGAEWGHELINRLYSSR